MGPMRAAAAFVAQLAERGDLAATRRLSVALYGSLGATGLGHGTPDAVVAGLRGEQPERVDPRRVRGAWAGYPVGLPLLLGGRHPIEFDTHDISFQPRVRLERHPNGIRLIARDQAGQTLADEVYFSIGGGFIVRDGDAELSREPEGLPYPYRNATELVGHAVTERVSVAEIARRNEQARHSPDELDLALDAIWETMQGCIDRGLATEGVLPGALRVPRRAARLAQTLRRLDQTGDDVVPTDWLQAWAMAVNEENAAGERVVTAPTNGAAGIIPSVGRYYQTYLAQANRAGVHDYLLAAAAIGSVVKANASISGAEGGCQAEVGSACAMAAAGLATVMGADPHQVENAAEIAIEHHLGLTCDPVGGLVQVPCIERNAIASATAISAARLAVHGDGGHLVSLDTAIETMRQTGRDMSTKYKETSQGGLAVNVVEC